jgi:HNH endonuclease
MGVYIPETIRRAVIKRAKGCCEYCRLHEDDLFLPFEIDHTTSLKHGGGSEFENLAYTCQHCNQYKGADLTTFLDHYQDIVPIFNPRIHEWDEHFTLNGGLIVPLSRIGKATVKLLKFNEPDILILRELLAANGLYPRF